ncbi:MAG TPA: hypothetical protein VGB87_20125 [Vicinamibacteria bacterium]
MKRLLRAGTIEAVLILAALVQGAAAPPLEAAPPPRAQAPEAFHCGLTEAGGVAQADAHTAARLVCEELRRASTGQGRFGVGLAALGRVVIVTATREDTGASVSVRVEGVEEIPVAAPRIASALAEGLAFATTQRVDNLLEDEVKLAKTKKGSVKFTLGVADVESPGLGARSAGFSLGLLYASPRFALPAEIRFAFDDGQGDEPELDLFSISVGGRAYLSKRDWSPFVGAGLGVLRLAASEDQYTETGYPGPEYFYADRFGLAAYVEAGVEVLRLHRGRIALHVRADLPTWSLESDAYAVYPYWDGRGPYPEPEYVRTARSRYVAPVSIGLTVAF